VKAEWNRIVKKQIWLSTRMSRIIHEFPKIILDNSWHIHGNSC
jgi:hypothetical protein